MLLLVMFKLISFAVSFFINSIQYFLSCLGFYVSFSKKIHFSIYPKMMQIVMGQVVVNIHMIYKYVVVLYMSGNNKFILTI